MRKLARVLIAGSLLAAVGLTAACDPSDPSSWKPQDVAAYLNLRSGQEVQRRIESRSYEKTETNGACHVIVRDRQTGTRLAEAESRDACDPTNLQVAGDSVSCFYVDQKDGVLKSVTMGAAEFLTTGCPS